MWMDRSLYDAFVVVYGTSLVLFFIDVMQPRRSVNRAAVALLFIAFSLETAFVLARLSTLGYIPVYSPFDVTLLISWLILLVALCINAFFRLDIILFFANIVGFALVIADAMSRQEANGQINQSSDLLVMHIASAVLSYALFCLAGVFSLMYLVQYQTVREKKWNLFYFRLPPLERLDIFTYRAVLIGYPLLTVAIVLGVVWEKLSLGHYIVLDAKPLITLLVWILYGVYIVLRSRFGWGSVALARFSFICFLIVLLNLWVGGRFSSFHHG